MNARRRTVRARPFATASRQRGRQRLACSAGTSWKTCAVSSTASRKATTCAWPASAAQFELAFRSVSRLGDFVTPCRCAGPFRSAPILSNSETASYDFAPKPRRHYPHLPEVRSAELSQPDRRAGRPGLARARTHAGLWQSARTDRRGAGSGRQARRQPDRRPGTKPGHAAGDAGGAQAEDPGEIRNRAGQTPGRARFSDLAGTIKPPGAWPAATTAPSARSSCASWNGCGTRRRTTARNSPGKSCSSWLAWATNIRWTSWRRNTSSPAARRSACRRRWKSRPSSNRSTSC